MHSLKLAIAYVSLSADWTQVNGTRCMCHGMCYCNSQVVVRAWLHLAVSVQNLDHALSLVLLHLRFDRSILHDYSA
jgi:hypothetical protein